MRLIGMLDSPYVRRVAVSLKRMGLDFTHESISVFSTYDAFAAINPVVKAPTLVTDSGAVLMDSTLIIDYLERLAPESRTLNPAGTEDFIRSQRIVGLALAACEKTVQHVYEHKLRPSEKRHAPWVDRVVGQMRTAYRLLDSELPGGDGWTFGDAPLQADITAAVAWRFSQMMIGDLLPPGDYPALAALSARAEALDDFKAYPHN